MPVLLKHLTEEEKTELTLLVLKQLTGTVKEFFSKDTVISTGLVLRLVDLAVARIEKEELKQLELKQLQHEQENGCAGVYTNS